MAELGTILNVNDHEQTRYMVSRMLRMAGFHVLEAASGEEALLLARSSSPDLLVLDVKLPDISGFEVARLLKSSADTSSIIVLQTSATFITVAKKIEGLDAGADGYLSHPFEPAELIATVRSLLRLRHVEQELRQRAEDLAQAGRRKDEFLAMLAHELRNPLAGITTALPLLRAYRDDDNRFAQLEGVIERQTRHLARLIDDLLDVSRVTRGKISLRKERMDLHVPLDEAVQGLTATLHKREQILEYRRCEGGPMWVDGDPARLQQVFVNLIDNASKYSEKGTRIDVHCSIVVEQGQKLASVRVSDQGIGIAPATLPHVFELFWQADESLERTRGGMGIGLTLVKRLVELHAGIIRAQSAGIGKGTVMEVRVPLASAPGTVVTPVRTELAPALPQSILLIEDNADAREMLQALLELSGHSVETAADGPSGVQRALEGNHDIAIVDIGLPGLNGFEVAQQIRATPRPRPLRLIALTGYGGDEQRKRALGAGFDVHLVKPVYLPVLLRVLSSG